MEENKTPPHWKKPGEVMRLHKLRMKKRALQFRFTDQESSKSTPEIKDENEKKFSTRNPFKRARTESTSTETKFDARINDDTTTDGTLFRLLNFSQSSQAAESPTSSSSSANLSFANAFSVLNSSRTSQKESESCKQDEIPVDWTLRLKVRLMSTQSFPWNRKLKTCEEASGITGFVRCIDTDTQNGEINLDTSPNARFHQCCLVWQHPSIPWLELFPRTNKRASASGVSVLPAKDALYSSWVDSFRSLFQLIRAKQCPYFYVVANSFICLFRAAGINGYPEMNVTITPTSKGFRQLLKDEDIEFTMPLKAQPEKKSPVTNDSTDTGYESLGLEESSDLNELLQGDDNDEEETDEWLQNIGIEQTEIKKFNNSQIDVTSGRERVIDKLPESLVFVEGVEAQAFFNFLMNCKSIIPMNGALAGVPPTLLSPVAFTGASLTSLKVKESVIRMNETSYHSMEVTGPILPHMVHNLCDLMRNGSLEKFSLTFADSAFSQAFTSATACQTGTTESKSPVKTPRTPSVFGEQNLSDCGLKPNVLARFCKNEVLHFDSIKFSDSHYTCS